MSFFLPFVTAAILVGPGVLVASLRRRSDLFTLIGESVLYAAIIDSALFWFTPLQRVPVAYYTGFLALLAVASIPFVFAARKRIKLDLPVTTVWEMASAWGCVLALVVYVVIGLNRAIIDWDAISYYLFSAIGMVTTGHASSYQPATITIGAHVPMAFPPVLPTMYAEAIVAGQWLHGTAESAVRLIPLLFLIGAASTIARLSRRFIPAAPPLAAVLLFFTMPIVLNYMVAQALSLDMLNAFAFAMLILEVVSYDGGRGAAVRIGLCATLVVMSKVTGPLLLVFLGIGAAGWYLPLKLARAVTALLCVALIASTAVVNPSAAQSLWFYLSCLLLLVTAVCAVVSKPAARPQRSNVLIALAALLPALIYLAAITKALGSPATFYLPTANVASPNFSWAFGAIKAANVFDSMNAPGLPKNYGLGLFFWWGAPPLMSILAAFGAYFAIRRRDEIAFLVIPVALFDLAFLTLFGEGDFRRLLPTAPFVAVLVVYGLYALPALQRYAVPALLGAIAVSFPFCYTAQETIFNVPIGLITGAAIDQWNGMSDTGLRNVMLYLAILMMPMRAVAAMNDAEPDEEPRGDAAGSWKRRMREELRLGLGPVGGVLQAWGRAFAATGASARTALIGAVVVLPVIVICFEPIVATAASPGFTRWADQVYRNQHYGYLPALTRITDAQKDGSVLAFQSFGVPWYTAGRLRRVELVDSFDLGLLRPALQELNGERLLDAFASYDIRSAIVPSPGGSLRREYNRLAERANLSALSLLDDPVIASRARGPEWSTYLVYPRSSGPAPRGLRLQAVSRGKAVDVSGRLSVRRGEFLDALRVVIPAERRTDLRGLHVRYTLTTSIGSAKTSAELERDVPLGKAADRVDISMASLASGANASTAGAATIDIHSVQVDLAGASPAVVDWRSMRFSAAKAGSVWNAEHTQGFFARAEALPVSRVRLADSQLIGGIHVFPGDVEAFGARTILNQDLVGDYPNLVLDLVASSVCPAGSMYDVRVDGTRAGMNPRSGAALPAKPVSYRAAYPAASLAVIDLRHLYNGDRSPQRLQVNRVAVTGKGRCAASERLHFPSIVIDQKGKLSYSTVGAVLEPDLTAASL